MGLRTELISRDKLWHILFLRAVSNLNIFVSDLWSSVIVYLVSYILGEKKSF